MDIKFISEAEAKRVTRKLVQDSKYIDIAVAWAGTNSVVDDLLQYPAKLRKVVIGTHMFQTSPSVLRDLMSCSGVRCMPPNGRLFHPKIYLFQLETGLAAIVGSHNLTAGAFEGGNIEASVLIRGAATELALRDLSSFVQKVWGMAKDIDEDFLFAYERQYDIHRAKRKALEKFHPIKKPRVGTSIPSPLLLPWSEFKAKVMEDLHHNDLPKRLMVLEGAVAIFAKKPHFADLDRDDRRAIAGTYGPKEEKKSNISWAWFGTMFPQGDFKNLVNDSPVCLSKALDCIPAEGEVSEDDYNAFTKLFKQAFEGKSHKGGVATASRLLCMKRPDVFVGVNNANRKGLCGAFEVAFSTLSLDNYWDRIVVPTQLSPWWQQDRPRGTLAGRIWDNRAALLDCIYFDPAEM
jgi:HKD family nuclease